MTEQPQDRPAPSADTEAVDKAKLHPSKNGEVVAAAAAAVEAEEHKTRARGIGKLMPAQREAAAYERATQRMQVKLEREHEKSAAKIAQMKAELDALRSDYNLASASKKLDLRELDGFSELAGEVIAAGRTGMNHDRLYTLWQAVHAAPAGAPVIEIGSYLGGSARFISETLLAAGRTPTFYVCDTWAGHADTDAEIDLSHHDSGKFEDAPFEATAAYLAGYPALELVVGDIVTTSAGLPDERFGLVHLDVDVYPPTDYCLRFFAPRLADGALMVIDDYGFVTCPGVKQAADEFVAEFPEYRLWHLLTGQALLWRAGGRA